MEAPIMNTVTTEQLEQLKGWGYSGQGDLESLIAWTKCDGLFLIDLSDEEVSMAGGEHGWQAIKGYSVKTELCDTPLAAVFALAEAIYGGKA